METFLQSNEIKIPKSNKVHPSKIDYKSSFARSLSCTDSSRFDVSKSLDFEINLQPCNEIETDNVSCDKKEVRLSRLDENLVAGDFIESFNKSDEDKERQLWSKKQQQQVKETFSDPIFGRAISFLSLSHLSLSLLTLIKSIQRLCRDR